MAKRSVVIRMRDILKAIDEAAEILAGMDFGKYTQSVVTRRAVERCVEIVSEASRHIPGDIQAQHPEIPWAEIRAIGNRLRHNYQEVDDHIVWRVAHASLAELKPVIGALIMAAEKDPPS